MNILGRLIWLTLIALAIVPVWSLFNLASYFLNYDHVTYLTFLAWGIFAWAYNEMWLHLIVLLDKRGNK